MKFWQKAFFTSLLLFLIVVDALGFMMLRRSYDLNAGYALQAALSEQSVIEKSLYDSITYTIANNGQTPESLRTAISPYASYYKNQGVSIAVYSDGEAVYDGFPENSPRSPDEI
jgi:hypothetical protein